MDLRLIRAFVALADELHFGRAAVRVHVGQAALSQQIRALEDELGARLFDRTTRRVDLSEVGRVFLPEARELLAAADRATARARRAVRGELGQLRIGFVSAAALGPLPDALRSFTAEHGEVELRLRELGTQAQLDALREGQLDVGFVLAPVEREGALATRVVDQGPLQVVVPSGHRLARRRRVALRELASEPIIWMVARSEPQLREHFVALCEAQGFAPRIEYEVDRIDSMLGLVAGGLGLSFAPQTAKWLRPQGVSFVTSSPRVVATIQLVWVAGASSPVLERFVDSATAR